MSGEKIDFVHLHLHTEYSLLDGAIRMKDLPQRLLDLGMSSCAITDHGVMFGVIDFYKSMTAAGLKPIIGCECYVASRGRFDKEGQLDKSSFHLILLAENNIGLANLNRLVSAGFVEGYYYRPRVDKELLEKHSEGIIALSACLGGEISQAILANDKSKAQTLALWYQNTFGKNNFFLEIQSNYLPDQARVNQELIALAKATNIPLVATSDCHYLRPEEAKAHEVLMCMQMGKKITDRDRFTLETDQLYLKSPEEMRDFFPHLPEALENTVKIAQRCNVSYDFSQTHLPHFSIPTPPLDGVKGEAISSEFTSREYLNHLATVGLKQRLDIGLKSHPVPEYWARLKTELDVIHQMGFNDYYLIVWDFIKYAKDNFIMVGPGRGSGAGSLVAYALGITNIDPVSYGLIFERFLNAERVSMPDFDIDFCYERRPEVIQYVTQKYGQERVAQVITFGTLAPRACLRDVARALDIPYAQADNLAKLVPMTLGITLEKTFATSPAFVQLYENEPWAKEVIDTAKLFEGMPRHASTHAAGVVISKEPLTDLVPLAKNDESIVVQFDKNNVEAIGLLKFDFLGLRTLTVLDDAGELIKKNYDQSIDFDQLALDDPNIYQMISLGDTPGVFQLESSGMTSFMMDLKPDSLEDIIAGISLYRPGPMDQIPQYVKARHDKNYIRYDHPLLEPILKVTYGCIVYQEQVMQIVRDLAGFSMGQADNIRRAMSKKNPALLAKYKDLFVTGGLDEKGRIVDGAVKNGVSVEVANKIFSDLMLFAGYAFNKSHAAAYALVGYWTAYLKYYYPAEFMAALLNSYRNNISQSAWYIRACKKMNLKILPPSVNFSQSKFTTERVDDTMAIRFGLSAVKNVGTNAINDMVKEREMQGEFQSYGDFLRRMHALNINKKLIESLIFSSALDDFGFYRPQLIAALEVYYSRLSSSRNKPMEGQLSLFNLNLISESETVTEPEMQDLKDFPQEEKLAYEKSVLGLYISGHPLEGYLEKIEKVTTINSAKFEQSNLDIASLTNFTLTDQMGVKMAGIVQKITTKNTKSKEIMAFVMVEDLFGSFEVIVFPKVYQKYFEVFEEGKIIWIRGKLAIKEDEQPKIIAEEILLLYQVPLEEKQKERHSYTSSADIKKKEVASAPVIVKENEMKINRSKDSDLRDIKLVICYNGGKEEAIYQNILQLLQNQKGETAVEIYLKQTNTLISLPENYQIDLSGNLLQEIVELVGKENIAIL